MKYRNAIIVTALQMALLAYGTMLFISDGELVWGSILGVALILKFWDWSKLWNSL